MVSAIRQHESAIGTHRCLPLKSLAPSRPSRLSQRIDFGFPTSYSNFPLAICFTYGNVYVSVLFSQIIPPLKMYF